MKKILFALLIASISLSAHARKGGTCKMIATSLGENAKWECNDLFPASFTPFWTVADIYKNGYRVVAVVDSNPPFLIVEEDK